jgi:C6 transcription factor Pro1
LSRQPDPTSRTPSHEPAPQFNFNGVYANGVSSVEADIFLPEELSSTDHSATPSLFDTSLHAATTGSYDSHSSESSETSSPSAKINAGATSNEAVDPILSKDSWSILPDHFGEDQASLLMHFFDHVLPLQFRFYNPSVLEGGRGWFLSILTRTKPLYLVALNLAAYHQQSILARGSRILCTASLEKLHERHIECIKVLRCHLQKFSIAAHSHSSDDCIEIMACITLLIALEVSLSTLESCDSC